MGIDTISTLLFFTLNLSTSRSLSPHLSDLAAVSAPIPSQMASDDWLFWAPKWQSRLRALTLVTCGAAVLASVTADWEAKFGDQHCFHGVKPAMKRMFNNILGVSSSSSQATTAPVVGATSSPVPGSSS